MIVCSIDIETTGLDPETCQVLEFAAVLYDTAHPFGDDEAHPSLHLHVTHPLVRGEPTALAMHGTLLAQIALRKLGDRCVVPSRVPVAFRDWLRLHCPDSVDRAGRAVVTLAGKNVAGFDLRFLRRLPSWSELIAPSHRSLDPAALYCDPISDLVLPGSTECCRRAGIDAVTSHRAMDDALMVCRLLSHKFHGAIL